LHEMLCGLGLCLALFCISLIVLLNLSMEIFVILRPKMNELLLIMIGVDEKLCFYPLLFYVDYESEKTKKYLYGSGVFVCKFDRKIFFKSIFVNSRFCSLT